MKLALTLMIVSFTFLLAACNKTRGIDTSELEAQTRGEIIKRSGTTFTGGTPEQERLALADAENRLRSGGGLFGKKGGINLVGGDSKEQNAVSIGMPINPYLWKGSLETVNFMPLASADPFSGIIITDWYTDNNNPEERCKLNIFIKGAEMKTDNLKVNSFCQKFTNGKWVDQEVSIENNSKLENAILNKAKKIRLSQS